MGDVIQPAASSRAKCRGCGRPIAKGELRFGESHTNPYADGETLVWFHLVCAACMLPERFAPRLDGVDQALPERDWLERAAEVGAVHRRLPRLTRAERASSGRGRCRQCHELVEKGRWRLALQMFEEGRPNPIGTLHAECAEPYFGTADILDRIERLTPELSVSDLAELRDLLAAGPGRRAPQSGHLLLAPLAKTQGPLAPGARSTGR